METRSKLGRVQAADERIERALIRRAARGFATRGTLPPLGRLLGDARISAAGSVLEELDERVRGLAPGLERGDPEARSQLERIAERALQEMRLRTDVQVGRSGLRAWAASVDAWWRGTTEAEYLDDPSLDQRLRVEILERLDDMNDLLGSYASFFARLERYLLPDRPTRVLDLAAGHGGFALAAARLAHDKGLNIEITASDIKSEYLEIGAARALDLGVSTRFVVQNALDLSNVSHGEYDVVTCTQSLHHFTAGEIAIMFSEASRIATRGVLFIDGARSALTAAAVVGLGVFFYRHRGFVHDSIVSFRRFFVPEELALLARLCPRGARARASFMPPGHCVLELYAH